MTPATVTSLSGSDRWLPGAAAAVLAAAGWALAAAGPGIASPPSLVGGGLLTAGAILGVVRRWPLRWLGWAMAGSGLGILAVGGTVSPLEGLLAGVAGLAFLLWAVTSIPGRREGSGLLYGLALPGLATGVGVGTALLLPSSDAQVGVAVVLALGVFGYLGWLLTRGAMDGAEEPSPI